MTEFITVCPSESSKELEDLAEEIIEGAHLYLVHAITQMGSKENSDQNELDKFYKDIFTALGKAYSKGIYDAFNDKIDVEKVQ